MSKPSSAAAKRGSPRGVVDLFRDRPRAGPPPFPCGDDRRGSLMDSEGSHSYRDVLRAEAAREAPTKEVSASREAESDAAADAYELRRQLQQQQGELIRRQEELDRRLQEEEEMQRLRRQKEELQRRQAALLAEERAMERRLREKAVALQRMELRQDEGQMPFRGLPSELVAPDLTKSHSSDAYMDTTPLVQPAPSSGMRRKWQAMLQRRAPRSGASISDSSSGDVERGDEETYSKMGKTSNNSIAPLATRRGAGRPFDRERRNSAMTLVRKILRAILTDVDDETLMREDTDGITVAITLLKEATIGLLIALFVVSLVLFIDHRFLLGLPTARNFRRATYHLMDDKVTLQTFEEAAGVKFVDEEEYAAMREEIAKAANRTQLANSILAQRSRDLWDTEREVASQVGEVSAIAKALDLDRYCERCVWNPRRNVRLCAVQTRALDATYQSDKVGELFASLKKRSCQKFEDKLAKTWDSKRSPFCAECEAAPNVLCSTQARDLSGKHNVSPVRAMARLMMKNPKCRRASREEEEERLRHFCPDCAWERGRTCQQRAGYLMYKDKYPARRAILAAMQRENCYRRKSGAVPAFV